MERSVSSSLLKNMNSELYINILKEKLPKMKRVALKIFNLVRDNVPAHISEATQQFIKERRLMNWKIGQLLAQIWIPLKMYGEL